MKCDVEGCENEATVHEVTIKGGQKVEKHLCDECARKHGVVVQMSSPPISELLTKFLGTTTAGEAQEVAAERGACPTCGMTWSKFRQSGLLGCATCYERFEKELTPLIERAHEGGAQHVGKTPRAAGAEAGARVRLAELRKKLSEAVQQERYEEAARLRDELRSASEALASGGGERKGTGEGSAGGEAARPRASKRKKPEGEGA